MNPLSQLPGKMDELLDSFMTHPIFGNTTFGFTNYIFWMCVALALLLIVIFVFVRKQKKSLPSWRNLLAMALTAVMLMLTLP